MGPSAKWVRTRFGARALARQDFAEGRTLSSLRSLPVRAVGRGAAWYRGDCHVHSVHSDGELTPEELAVRARAAGLDFMATTEHNSAADSGVWGHLAADDFLIVLGEEVTTKTGHWLALGISPGEVVDWNHHVGDGLIDQCLDQVHRVGGPVRCCAPACALSVGRLHVLLPGIRRGGGLERSVDFGPPLER
ncbi:CehA/McbA family metallohydrolase [Streptomyces sp. NPDC048680]|uniref:CehA/McbA family metallohydrolase n=1 Tax=Streptomyces sp. NPDC048680 TaxID=3155492 RepID=UPI003436DD19